MQGKKPGGKRARKGSAKSPPKRKPKKKPAPPPRRAKKPAPVASRGKSVRPKRVRPPSAKVRKKPATAPVRARKPGGKVKPVPARKPTPKQRRASAAKKGWETRRKNEAEALRIREQLKQLKRKKPVPRKPAKHATKKERQAKSKKTRELRRKGAQLEDVIYYEKTGFIHRTYDVGDYDPDTFRVDPSLIADVIRRELMEGNPGTFHATVAGITEDGLRIERNTPSMPTRINMADGMADEIARIIAEYEFVGVFKITLVFLPQRQHYANTTPTERKRVRRVRGSGH